MPEACCEKGDLHIYWRDEQTPCLNLFVGAVQPISFCSWCGTRLVALSKQAAILKLWRSNEYSPIEIARELHLPIEMVREVTEEDFRQGELNE